MNNSLPSTPRLGRWLRSWIHPTGAIHGFHNHSVWGGNPLRLHDMTAGHSTFASPLMLALQGAIHQQPDSRASALLETLAHFQATSFQADGQFAHIGFQCGETLKSGLIHNVVPCAVLSALPASEARDKAVRQVLARYDALQGAWPTDYSCANQEYCRLWARMLHMRTYDHRQWHDETALGLDYMIAHFHRRGNPDGDCAGTLRVRSNEDMLEPAEYYGLMIHPLLEGYRRYGTARYLDEARAIARHCVRSSWIDRQGCRRAHRMWMEVNGQWIRTCEPMLIGGFGLTLSAIQALARLEPDTELETFLTAMDTTYAHYQSGAGFFLAASGWEAEPDIIPSSAWQSHDFYHLVLRHALAPGFWDTLFAVDATPAVVLGRNEIWMEDDQHWMLGHYMTQGLQKVHGRKDAVRILHDIPAWIDRQRALPENYKLQNPPEFLRTEEAIYHRGGRTDLHLLNATGLPYIGPVA